MTITREQVADLQPGDVVEYSGHPDLRGAKLVGPLHIGPTGSLCIADYVVSSQSGGVGWKNATLTVVSRAPRPLYVNHPRTEPVASDVMHRDGDDPWRMFGYSGDRWVLVGGTHEYETDDLRGAPFRLLVDGETGQVVP